MRELLNLKIKKISLVGSPASRQHWLLKKSEDGKGLAELIAAVNDFTGSDLSAVELLKAIDADGFEEIKKALGVLSKYKMDMPDDVADAQDVLAKWAAKGAGYGTGEYPKKEVEKEIKKSVDWSSFKLPGEVTELRIEAADDEEEEEGIQDYDDPFMHQLLRIDQRLSTIEKGDKGEDKWSSFEVVAGHFVSAERLAKMLPEEIIEERPVKKEKPDSHQIRGHVRVPEEVEDKWSSWIL